MSGEYGIPEFRTGDFHSTASMKGSDKQRDEVEPKRDLLPPTILRMESGMPGYATLRGYVWYRKNSHCEISQELSLKSIVISKKNPWESYLTSLSLFLGLEGGNSDLLPKRYPHPTYLEPVRMLPDVTQGF